MFDKNKINEVGYKKYQELNEKELIQRYNEIIDEWQKFLAQNDPTLKLNKDYFVHRKNLFEIIRRCDKRNLYFYIFHELEDLSEFKNVALEAFWIINLKPFMVIKEDANIYNCPNELFALFLILSVIEGAFRENKPEEEFKPLLPKRVEDIIYDFKYCSISREAMIAFVETLADTYGVGISFIMSNKE